MYMWSHVVCLGGVAVTGALPTVIICSRKSLLAAVYLRKA